MKQFFYVLTSAVLILSGCTESFKKEIRDWNIKLYPAETEKKIAYSNFMQLHIKQFYKDAKRDTTLSDTRMEGMPQLVPLDSTSFPPEYYKIFRQVKVGDSVVVRMKTDSLMKNSSPQNPPPPFMKKGQHIYITLKVLNIFDTPQQADSANKIAYMAKMKIDSVNAIGILAKDDKTIADYLAKKQY
ncbi:MAG: hypothetical protein IPJ81_19190 [Chitinophagaceae bacterium]|nr:hypothetical protein [Chitinophagaceae bacterium]